MKSFSVAILLTWLVAASAFADNSFGHSVNIDQLFAKWNQMTPGCSVGTSLADHVEYMNGFGSADLEHGTPNSPETIFEAGSVSKQFTAMAMLLLVRDGKLSLDDAVRKYVPELPEYERPITIREILTHTSGLRDWGDIATIEGWPRGTREYTDADLLKIVSRQKALNFLPGTRWSYSNTGYNLAEIIVSRVSGLSLAEFSHQRIFLPLGMAHTSWRDDYTRIVPGRAIAYSRKQDGFHSDMPFEDIYGNGGLLTTVGDLLKWNAHLSLPDAADAELVQSQQQVFHLTSGRPTDYGLGLFIRDYKGAREISHTGQTAGYTSFLARYPSHQISIAILCNAEDADTWSSGHAIADLLIPDTPKHSVSRNAVSLSAAEMKQLEGTYRDVVTGRPIKIFEESGKIHFGDYSIMVPSEHKRFVMDGKSVELDARGSITLKDSYGIVDQYDRVAPYSPTPTMLGSFAGPYTSPEIGNSPVYVQEAHDGRSIIIQFGTKTTLTLSPSYQNAFSNSLVTAVFSTDEGGRASAVTISAERVWNLRLARIHD